MFIVHVEIYHFLVCVINFWHVFTMSSPIHYFSCSTFDNKHTFLSFIPTYSKTYDKTGGALCNILLLNIHVHIFDLQQCVFPTWPKINFYVNELC